MRMIDADALLLRLKQPTVEDINDVLRVEYDNAPNDVIAAEAIHNMYETVREAIKEAPIIESPRTNWTPCAEGLPESDLWRDDGFRKTYPVTVERDSGELQSILGNPYRYVTDASFELGEWVLASEFDEFDESDNVIAWMEQPEPYNPNHIVDANKKADQFREPTKMIKDKSDGR